MTPKIIDENQLRERIVAELNIGHLDVSEQEEIMGAVSDVLLKRASVEVMRRMSAEARAELDKLTEAGDEAAVSALVRKCVPNLEEVATQAAREGLAEHKRLVAELVTKQS